MKRLKILLPVLVLVGFALSFFWQNFSWIGEACSADSAPGTCARQLDQPRTRFLNLGSCIEGHKGQPGKSICASGPNPDKPEMDTASSFRQVYFLPDAQISEREVPYSYGVAFLGAVVGGIVAIAVAFIGRAMQLRSSK